MAPGVHRQPRGEVLGRAGARVYGGRLAFVVGGLEGGAVCARAVESGRPLVALEGELTRLGVFGIDGERLAGLLVLDGESLSRLIGADVEHIARLLVLDREGAGF